MGFDVYCKQSGQTIETTRSLVLARSKLDTLLHFVDQEQDNRIRMRKRRRQFWGQRRTETKQAARQTRNEHLWCLTC